MSAKPSHFLIVLASTPHCSSADPNEIKAFVEKHVKESKGKLTDGDFIRAFGPSFDVGVRPPQKDFEITIGAVEKKSDGYKACKKGDECKGKEDGKIGNAYKKPYGLCSVDYNALPENEKVKRERKEGAAK